MTPLHYLIVSAALFATGLFGALSRRDMLKILISVEIMLFAANINFAAFGRFCADPQTGNTLIWIVSSIAGLQAALGLIICNMAYKKYKTVIIDSTGQN